MRCDGRADRPQSRRTPRSYQVTLDGLGKAAATKHWQVGRKPTFGNRVSRRQPELSNSNQTPHPYGDIEFGNVPRVTSGVTRRSELVLTVDEAEIGDCGLPVWHAHCVDGQPCAVGVVHLR